MTTVATSLRGLCGGAVHLPGDPGYDTARTPWNLTADQRPAAVAYPADADEVASVVRAAARAGLRVAAQGTGHNPGPLGPLDDVVLLRTPAMTGVTVAGRTARAEAGALWVDVVELAAPHGLAALHGSSPDLGVVGYSLGGGVGWYARTHGLQANALTAVELVTAGGTLLRADATREPDLFWALRGGGGNFGVVTAVEFDLFPIVSVYAGLLAWDWRAAPRVLPAWLAWAATAPDAATTALRLLRVPPLRHVPPALRGRRLLVVDGAVLGPAGPDLVAPLRALRPEVDTFAELPPAALPRLHLDPEGPTPVVSRSALLGDLPAAAADALLAAAGPDSGTSLAVPVELRQLGGALARPAAGGGALPVLDGAFALSSAGIAATPELAAGAAADAGRVVAALAPWATGSRYLNLTAERVAAEAAFPPATVRRLRAIRAAVDPGGLFVANHPL
ncbi:FAD-binding oxidoreductase [Dactylosporangium aurantiacum]|uniref:FAD-binding oxidoreductase n=1 Tax=Dactylosporangium aurantiacum TaxID=35754 RepID=A0A9Q9IDM3_9ACTN|nr:FAD-binding oxidoreductase [Dactylosporangium aurantiacum]MDG6101643.1 FAD-binding oxidoreductase [Dactylosporangium aurantiacum]UWZ52533.1 FAD-binding oxidoreductase [Dactylosporangium aurantiacum]